ncbi:isochorismatase [Bacillus sp. AFS076308]|uniref:isochorismatase family cysteine hydrolase n=1 Tax=unclassified Bacillus (in: firmicutes) TaxID=185979 RepID=UPI000BF36A64|nr:MULTISPECIES: isochorismatase family cysteine hydrolase [unclassified Bacillus (in: firmicutes)]PFN74929.1 isochorismatase [Bacillus sp. AFS076308]PGV48526.1 isochorismatase [Bacillus sp. AFS037270]
MDQIRPALLIIDMINNFDFTHGPILAQKALKIAEQIKEVKDQFNQQQLPVIFINDHYNLWQADYHRIIEHCRNQYSEPIYKKVLPGENDFFLIKPKHSAFYGTALNTLLHQLKVNTLIVTGIAGNICVLFTANDAYMREYKLLIPNDCIASADDQDNQYALMMMKNVLKAVVKPSQNLSTLYHVNKSALIE